MTAKAIYTYLFGVGESHLGKLVVGYLVDAVLGSVERNFQPCSCSKL